MKTCKNCKHWGPSEDWDSYAHPKDPDTYGEMANMPFKVDQCRNPQLLFCERPVEENQAAVCDGSSYMAKLYTGPKFGCTDFQEQLK
jgi:hypothetical protein